MRHEAEQFDLLPFPTDLFPDRETFEPGDRVTILKYVPGKKHLMPDKTRPARVISWTLFYLLTGEDPEYWNAEDFLEDGPTAWNNNGPAPGAIPIFCPAMNGIGNRFNGAARVEDASRLTKGY